MNRLIALLCALVLVPTLAFAQALELDISDGVHGSFLLSPTTFLSPGSPSILNTTSGQPLIFQKGVATTGADAGDFRFDRNANYTGGTHGFVNPALYGNCSASAGAISFEWCGLFRMDNSSSAADAAENVALYAQSHKRNGGGTWALVAELQDHNANPVTPSVTLEFDLQTKGTDTNNSRVIQDLWGKTDDGNPTVIGNGMRFNTDASTTLTNGLTFQGATIGNAAIALGAGQKLCLDGTTCANYVSQSSGTTTFTNGGVTALTASSIGSNVIALNSSGQITQPAGSKHCFDATTCSNYITQSGGTTTFVNGGVTALTTSSIGANVVALNSSGQVTVPSGQKVCLDGTSCTAYATLSGGQVVLTGGSGVLMPGVAASSLATSGNISVPTNQKICLNGAGCSIYMTYNGTSVSLFNGGTSQFVMNMSTGQLNIAGAYAANGFGVGTTCSGAPTASFNVSGGIVTHC